jgi:glycosyltransferase involved in cell wall biosynthesis
MACGLPVVASKVGVNADIVQPGQNGFLATSTVEWVAALGRLLEDRSLRARMGAVGRRQVEARYSLQVTGPILVELLRSVAKGESPCAA